MQNPWEYSGAQPQLHPVIPTGKLPSCRAELPTSFPAGHSTSKHPKFLFPAPSSFWHRLTHSRPCTVHRQKVFAQALHGKREQGKFHAGASGAASCRSKHFAGENLGSTAGKAGNDGSHPSTSGTARGEMEGELRSSRCARTPSHPSSTRFCSGCNSRSGHTQRATGTAPPPHPHGSRGCFSRRGSFPLGFIPAFVRRRPPGLSSMDLLSSTMWMCHPPTAQHRLWLHPFPWRHWRIPAPTLPAAPSPPGNEGYKTRPEPQEPSPRSKACFPPQGQHIPAFMDPGISIHAALPHSLG